MCVNKAALGVQTNFKLRLQYYPETTHNPQQTPCTFGRHGVPHSAIPILLTEVIQGALQSNYNLNYLADDILADPGSLNADAKEF